MNKWKSYGSLLSGLLVIGAILYLVLGGVVFQKPEKDSPKKQAVTENLPEMEFSGTKLSEIVDEKVNWELTSQSLIMDKEKNAVTFHKTQGIFFQEGKKSLTLQGQKGFFDLTSKNIQLEGDVEVLSVEGEKLQAQKIAWVAEKQKLQGQGKVVFIRGDTKVVGDHFETDLALENLQITGNVRVLIGGK